MEIRILIITTMYPPERGGGVSSHTFDLSEALSECGHKVVVVTLGKYRSSSTNLVVYGGRNLVHMFLICFLLLVKEKIDIVHCHSPHTVIFGLPFKILGKVLVLTFHGESSIWQKSIHKWGNYDIRFIFLKLYEKIAIKIADSVIAVDARLKDFVNKYRYRNVFSLLNCVNVSFFNKREYYSNKPWEKIILCPRLLYPKNGVRYAIAAFEYISRKIPDAKLLIAGDGPLRAELTALAREVSPEMISFLGQVSYFEMPQLYSRSAVVVIPSITVDGLQEASSIAALEAMSSGTPLIASRIGGLKEIIVNEVTGFLVAEQDAEEIAQKAILLLNNKGVGISLGEEARKYVLKSFSRDKWVEEIIKIYKSTLNRKGQKSV